MRGIAAALLATVFFLLCGCRIADLPIREDAVGLATPDKVWKYVDILEGTAAGDNFGYAVALSDTWAVVGAPGTSSNKGSVSIYRTGSWTTAVKTIPGDSTEDRFGAALAISAGRLVVGAPSNINLTSGTPGAYLFGYTTDWVPLVGASGRLVPGVTLQPDEEMGRAVAIDGDRVIVGCWGYNSTVGRAFLFEKDSGGADTWGRMHTLPLSALSGTPAFGIAAALLGDYGFIGAGASGDIVSLGGKAYVYLRGTSSWADAGSIPNPLTTDIAYYAEFGSSASARGSQLVVGAPGTGANAAYVFQLSGSTWSQTGKLVQPVAVSTDRFGGSVSTDGSTIVIGAPNHKIGTETNAGAVYFYDAGTLTFLDDFFSGAPSASAKFGQSVAVSGSWAIVGAPGENGKGIVYIYNKQ